MADWLWLELLWSVNLYVKPSVRIQNGWCLQDPCELSTPVVPSADWASDSLVEFFKNTEASASPMEILTQ